MLRGLVSQGIWSKITFFYLHSMLKKFFKSIICWAVVITIFLQWVNPAAALSFSTSVVTAQSYRSPQFAFIVPVIESVASWVFETLATEAIETAGASVVEALATEAIETAGASVAEALATEAIETADVATYEAVAGRTVVSGLEVGLANSIGIDAVALREAGSDVLMYGMSAKLIYDVYTTYRKGKDPGDLDHCKPVIIRPENGKETFKVYDSSCEEDATRRL